jgi:hypothetical protein
LPSGWRKRLSDSAASCATASSAIFPARCCSSAAAGSPAHRDRYRARGLGASVSVTSDAPYAAIHEYGGTIPAHTILPQSARALAFPWRGQPRFFKRVQLPAVAMPERSFMRSALDETAPEIQAAIEAAAFEAVQG